MDNWREELWRDGLSEASSDSDFWTAGTEWGAEWMLQRLDKIKADTLRDFARELLSQEVVSFDDRLTIKSLLERADDIEGEANSPH